MNRALAGLLLLLAGCTGTGPVGQGGPARHDNAARLRVAAAAEASGQSDVALSMLATAAAASPDDPVVQSRYAAVLLRSGDTGRAEAVLLAALRRHPEATPLLVGLGRLRLQAGSAPEAVALFDRVLKVEPAQAAALSGRGVGLDLLNRSDEALASHRLARLQAPDDIGIANNLAVSLLLAGRPAEAEAILAPLARRPGSPPRVTVNLAVARAAQGDREGAETVLGGASPALGVMPLAQALTSSR